MDDRSDLDVMAGARNAIGVCLNVSSVDRVWILADEDRSIIGEALATAARERDATVELRMMEQFGLRPLVGLPDGMASDIRSFEPTVTILATGAKPGEIRFRLPFARLLRQELHVRHGHMIGVTPQLLQSGMLADYQRVAALTFMVVEMMQQAREVHVVSELGTELQVTLDNERYRWIPFHGLYHQAGQWGNLPEGEACTVPLSVDGVLKAELLGDYFCERYGVLQTPLSFEIEDGWVTRVQHEEQRLADEVWEYLDRAVNGRRVGEFGVGTNEALHELKGNLLQDEKFPGIHLAFGNPIPEVTGAEWSSDIHVDAIATHCTVWLDGEPLMQEGVFTV